MLGQWTGWELATITEARRSPPSRYGSGDTTTFSTVLLVCFKRPAT
jgi:hypothetical protein